MTAIPGRYDHRSGECVTHGINVPVRRVKGAGGAYECVVYVAPVPATADQAAREAVLEAVAHVAAGVAIPADVVAKLRNDHDPAKCECCLAQPKSAASPSAVHAEAPPKAEPAEPEGAADASSPSTASQPGAIQRGAAEGAFRVGQRVQLKCPCHLGLRGEITSLAVARAVVTLGDGAVLADLDEIEPIDEQPESERVLTVRVPAGVRELRVVIGDEEGR